MLSVNSIRSLADETKLSKQTCASGFRTGRRQRTRRCFQPSTSAATGFLGVLCLSNIGGCFFWASISDTIGRKNTYTLFFALGPVLYPLVPFTESTGSVVLFVVCFAVFISMSGGGFETVPAYLRDLFGGRYVGANHGRLLPAWSVANTLSPVPVNYIREYQILNGIPKVKTYDTAMIVMAG